MASSFQRGLMASLANLHGTARLDNGGGVVLTYAAPPEPGGVSRPPERVFEAFKRAEGEWAVRYRWPLSTFQAFAIAVSVLHCPTTSGLDGLEARPSTADAPPPTAEAQLSLMAKAAAAALRSAGLLAAAHRRQYTPVGGDQFATQLMELLARVGLTDGERQERALQWASEMGVSSLKAMHALLAEPASAEWEQLLDYLAPTKAFHKERIRRQLRRATGNAAADELESSRGAIGPSYWAQLG